MPSVNYITLKALKDDLRLFVTLLSCGVKPFAPLQKTFCMYHSTA